MEKKKILVVSHERSGTHFLINSIILNFPNFAGDGKVINVPVGRGITLEVLKTWFQEESIKNLNIPYKSHHQYYWFQNFFDRLLESFYIFYIIRDGRDVMTSCFHYYNKCYKEGLEHFLPLCADTMENFLRIDPAGKEIYPDETYSLRSTPNLIERWVVHIKGWLEVKDKISIISYEELSNNFEDTIQKIGSILNLKYPQKPGKPDLFALPSVLPRKGVVGDWKNYFTKEDLIFFDKIAFDCMKDLGYYKREDDR